MRKNQQVFNRLYRKTFRMKQVNINSRNLSIWKKKDRNKNYRIHLLINNKQI